MAYSLVSRFYLISPYVGSHLSGINERNNKKLCALLFYAVQKSSVVSRTYVYVLLFFCIIFCIDARLKFICVLQTYKIKDNKKKINNIVMFDFYECVPSNNNSNCFLDLYKSAWGPRFSYDIFIDSKQNFVTTYDDLCYVVGGLSNILYANWRWWGLFHLIKYIKHDDYITLLIIIFFFFFIYLLLFFFFNVRLFLFTFLYR